MHNEDVLLRSNVIPSLVAGNVIECTNFGNSCRHAENNLRLRCAYHPYSPKLDETPNNFNHYDFVLCIHAQKCGLSDEC